MQASKQQTNRSRQTASRQTQAGKRRSMIHALQVELVRNLLVQAALPIARRRLRFEDSENLHAHSLFRSDVLSMPFVRLGMNAPLIRT
jgi:hypothetical protein